MTDRIWGRIHPETREFELAQPVELSPTAPEDDLVTYSAFLEMIHPTLGDEIDDFLRDENTAKQD